MKKAQLTQQQLHLLCAHAEAALPTVRRYFSNEPMRPGTAERITRTLERIGLEELVQEHRK